MPLRPIVIQLWLCCGIRRKVLLLMVSGLLALAAQAEESVCYGTVSKGRLQGGVMLPAQGPNYSAYSQVGAFLGRTYVHSKVAKIVVEAYAALAKALPHHVFVYGETGWRNGGPFRPHRTHQNGLSVDFFVPVLNAEGKSVPMPIAWLTRFGYDLEFDAKARHEALQIDFPALAEHLYQLQRAAERHGAGIKLVIFDPAYWPQLFATPRGERMRSLPFMRGKAWVRHDEHVHVDFAVPCRP